MPRLALTLVAALTATALAACGDSGSTSNGAVDSTTALDTAVEADTTEPSDTTAPDDADAGDTTAPGDAADAADTADTADTSAPTCAGDSDCSWCQYPTAPVFESDCYCLNCAQTVLDTTTCEANAAAWADVCSAWATSCPLAGFCPPPDNDPACMGGHCEDPCALVDCAAPDCPASEWVREPGQCCQTCRDPAACDENGDCGWCVYDKPVETQSDCYCRACPTAALATDVCSDYAAQWAANCPDGWDEASPCPVPRCAVPHDVACDPAEGSCVDACSLVTCPELACAPADRILDPGACCPRCRPTEDSCDDAGDCQRCLYEKPVLSVADCYCTLCTSHATTKAQCTLWGQQWQATCAGTWREQNPCPVAICLPPAPVDCGTDGTCGGCDDVVCPELDCPASRRFTPEGACCETCAPAPEPCSDEAACSWCAYPRGVASEAECYCPVCPTYGVTAAQCSQWQSEWATHCTAWEEQHSCPVALCLPRPPIACDEGGACVADPSACTRDDDCTRCQYATAPTSSAECQCPGCGTPMTTATCEANTAAVATYCSNGELDDCLPTPCPAPPSVSCNSAHACVDGRVEFTPER